MRRKIFSIWSVLLVLVVSIAVLVPGCGGEEELPPEQCYIEVEATLNGSPWEGELNYTLTGPGAEEEPITGSSVPYTFTVECGDWILEYISGGPEEAMDLGVDPEILYDLLDDDDMVGWGIEIDFKTVVGALIPHYRCYEVSAEGNGFGEKFVQLEDQFCGAFNATVTMETHFCNPCEKRHNDVVWPNSFPDCHLMLYELNNVEVDWTGTVVVNNQGGEQTLKVSGPILLGIPTWKWGNMEPLCLDHYLLYMVTECSPTHAQVWLEDQFNQEWVNVIDPVYFANPVKKTHGDMVCAIRNPD
jgi:hypothetical protein